LNDVVETGGRLVQTNAKLRLAVSQLVAKTWNSKQVGVGNDAVSLCHQSVAVTNIWQIENVAQYKRYVIHMKETYRQNALRQVPRISELQGEKGIETLTEGMYFCA